MIFFGVKFNNNVFAAVSSVGYKSPGFNRRVRTFLSNNVHDTLTHIIINNRRDALVKYIQPIIQTFNFKSALFHSLCDNHWMFYRLAITGCLRKYPQEELWKVVYKMKHTYYLTHHHLSMNEIYDMQDCFHYLNTVLLGWTIKIKHFLNIMSTLRERRLRIAKKNLLLCYKKCHM